VAVYIILAMMSVAYEMDVLPKDQAHSSDKAMQNTSGDRYTYEQAEWLAYNLFKHYQEAMSMPSKRIDGSIYYSCCEDPHARLVVRKSLSVGCKLGKAVPATSVSS
jgi:hypothetical protein